MNLDMGGYGIYVWASFALFVVMLVWDYLSPRIRFARARRAVLARGKREAARRANMQEGAS
ncbi:MAG: heme exporter protein CcmD [Lysobacteraceae bacterium]